MTQTPRDWQKEKYTNLIKRCEMAKSYGETICVDPDAIIAIIETAARADAAEAREQRLKEDLRQAIAIWENMADFADPEDIVQRMISAIRDSLYPDTPAPTPEITARPIEEWHEDMGCVIWWEFPISEPPHCGTPLDMDWPGYHTHWTPIEIPASPAPKEGE